MIQSDAAFLAAMKSKIRTPHLRVDILDKNENLIDRAELQAVSGQVTVDAKRDSQREFSLVLLNRNNKFTWGSGRLIWLDKRIKIYTGLETPIGISYVPQGVFLIDPTAISRSNGTREAPLRGGDKSTSYGTFTYTTTVKKSVNVGEAIRQLAEDAEETKFAFDTCGAEVPYDLTYQSGESRWAAMKNLAEMALMRVWHDVNGFLRLTPLSNDPTTLNVTWSYDARDPNTLYAGSSMVPDFQDTFNVVLVVGGSPNTGTVHSIASNDDPNHPLSTVNIGERLFRYNNGSPDALITTVQLAQNRAQYELDEHTNYLETHRIDLIPNYLHEVGDVIRISDPAISTDDKFEVTRVTIPFGSGMMTAEARRIRRR